MALEHWRYGNPLDVLERSREIEERESENRRRAQERSDQALLELKKLFEQEVPQ